MKKFILLFLLIPLLSLSQTVPSAPNTCGTVADLRLQGGSPVVQVNVSGLLAPNDGNGGIYTWDDTSTAADDGFLLIKATSTSTGRWKRIGNSNTLKGSVILSGGALTTAYTVNYQNNLPFVPLTVIVIPRTSNAAVPSWVSTITNTGFTLNFTSVPILGTNNIGLDYIVVKQ